MESLQPTHFDLAPFQQALKRFLAVPSRSRSQMRAVFHNNHDAVRSVFTDEHEEPSFKRCVDIGEMSSKLQQAAVPLDNSQLENLGATLICFGEVALDERYGDRVPPETDEQKRAKLKLERLLDRKKQDEQKEKKALQKALTGEELKAKEKADEEERKE